MVAAAVVLKRGMGSLAVGGLGAVDHVVVERLGRVVPDHVAGAVAHVALLVAEVRQAGRVGGGAGVVHWPGCLPGTNAQPACDDRMITVMMRMKGMMLAMVHIGDSRWMKDFRGRVTLASSMSRSLVAGAEVVVVTGYALRQTFKEKKRN